MDNLLVISSVIQWCVILLLVIRLMRMRMKVRKNFKKAGSLLAGLKREQVFHRKKIMEILEWLAEVSKRFDGYTTSSQAASSLTATKMEMCKTIDERMRDLEVRIQRLQDSSDPFISEMLRDDDASPSGEVFSPSDPFANSGTSLVEVGRMLDDQEDEVAA